MSDLKLPNENQEHPWIQTAKWLMNPIAYMENCAKRYGDIFTLRLGPSFQPLVLISNPQAIQQIFTTVPKDLDSGASAGMKPIILGNNSLIFLDGKPHQKQRKLLTPAFHGERILTYGKLIAQITQEVTSEWKIGEEFSVLSYMQEISFQVILKAVFGLTEGTRYQKLKQLLMEILNPKRPFLRAIIFFFPILNRDFGAWSPGGNWCVCARKLTI